MNKKVYIVSGFSILVEKIHISYMNKKIRHDTNDFVQKTRTSNRQADGIRYSIFFVISIFPAASRIFFQCPYWALARSKPQPRLGHRTFDVLMSAKLD
jgi:hypothetical protein